MSKIFLYAFYSVLLVCGISNVNALEFMDESQDYDLSQTNDNSAELPLDSSYTRDTIANYNPTIVDANFKNLWERVPLRKVDTIKK